MRKVHFNSNMGLVAVKNFSGGERRMDLYLLTPGNERLYAFTGTYTKKSYDLCKSGIRVNDLVGYRSRNTGLMRLVNQVNRMLPYLAELYDLPLTA